MFVVRYRLGDCDVRVYLAESELQSNKFGYQSERHRCGRREERCRSTPGTCDVTVWGIYTYSLPPR